MMREGQELGVIHVWMEEGGHPALDEREAQGLLHEVLDFVQHNSAPFFSWLCSPYSTVKSDMSDQFLFLLSGFGFAKKGKWAEGGGTAVRDRSWKRFNQLWQDQRWRVCMGSCAEPCHAPPCPPSILPQKTPPISNHHHLCTAPTRAQGSCTWSFWSCHGKISIGTGSPLSSCIRGSRGGYPHPYDIPSPAVGGHQVGV